MAIQRIVCFRFKPGTSPEAIQQHMDDFADLQGEIEQIREYRAGLTRPGDDNAPPGYDCMHYAVFDSLEDIEIYRPHPAHLRFIERNREHWDGVLVLNSVIDQL